MANPERCDMAASELNDQASVDPKLTLHPIRGVVWATFWGTPIAASIVMAINYWRTGNRSNAGLTLLTGSLATFAYFAILFMLPEDLLENLPNAVFYVPQLIMVYAIASRLQSQLIESHKVNGGRVASAWPSVGIGLVCLPFVLVPVLGIALLLETSFDSVVKFGDDEVFYSGDATEEDARKLAGVLRDIEFFGTGGASVSLEISSGQTTVSFVLVDNTWAETQTLEAFKNIGRTLVESGFSTPLTIQLCDDYFDVQKTFDFNEA